MLKDAALLHLELMRDALAAGFILKDSSAYNVQWLGVAPVFIDIPSIEPLGPGEPWVGYRQFCELFLYPLMLQAYRGVDFRPWLRGRIDGIPAEEMRRLMSARDLLRRRGAAACGRAERAAAAVLDRRAQRAGRARRRRVRQEPDRDERREAGSSRPGNDGGPDIDRVVGLRPDALLRRRRIRRQGGLREACGGNPPLAAASGISAATPAPFRGSSRPMPTRSSRWTPTGWRWSACTSAIARTSESGGILPLVTNLADASPEPGLARPRAQGSRGAGRTRPDAVPRARPPRRDHRQHSARRLHRLAAESPARRS